MLEGVRAHALRLQFVDGGMRDIVRKMPAATSDHSPAFEMGRTGSIFNALEVYKMSSTGQTGRKL